MRDWLERRRHAVALAALLALALGLRLLHLDFGLPARFHPDEIGAAEETLKLVRGRFALHSYAHPPLVKMLAFAGLESASPFLGRGVLLSPIAATLALRAVSALAGAGAVAALYFLALRFVGPRHALIAAALYAVFPLAVFSSKYGVPDMLLACLINLSLLSLLAFAGRPTAVSAALCGLCCALTAGAKYNGIFLAFPAAVAFWRRDRTGPAAGPLLGAAFVGALAGLVVSFPFVAEWRDVLSGGRGELAHLFSQGHRGIRASGMDFWFTWHLRHSLLPAAGPLLLLASLAGLVLLALRRRLPDLVLLALVVPFFLAIEITYLVPPSPERYALPLVGPLLIAAVVLLERVEEVFPRRWMALALPALLLAWPAVRTASLLRTLTPDTRESMGRWIAQRLGPGATLWIPDIVSYAPELPGRRWRVLSYDATDPDSLPGRSGDYVLASRLDYGRYFDFPGLQPGAERFFQDLFAKGVLLHREQGGAYLFNNPDIALYRLP